MLVLGKDILVADVMDVAVGQPMPDNVSIEQVTALAAVTDQEMPTPIGAMIQ